MARTEHVRYLAMVPNYWGIGDTVGDAVEELVNAGGHIDEGYSLYEFPRTTIFQSVHPVFGEITFTHADGESEPVRPSHRKVEALEALTTRKQDITRSLVNDDCDLDAREMLQYEREEINEALAALTAQ